MTSETGRADGFTGAELGPAVPPGERRELPISDPELAPVRLGLGFLYETEHRQVAVPEAGPSTGRFRRRSEPSSEAKTRRDRFLSRKCERPINPPGA